MFINGCVCTLFAIAFVLVGGCERSVERSDVGSSTTSPVSNTTATTAAAQKTPPGTRPTTGPATAPAAQNPVKAQDPAERLHGTWVAEDVDVKMGQVKIRLVFKEDGPVKIAAWSDIPFVGQVRDKTAPYEVDGNTISSEAIRGGTTVNYRFDGDDLIIEYKDGKTVRFHRA